MTAGGRRRFVVEGSAVFRVRAGQDPSGVPHHGDVALGACHPFLRFDGGMVERVLRRFTPSMKIARVFAAARAVDRVGARHEGWDDLEVRTGMSRTYRVDLDPDADLGALVDSLSSLECVEMASPHYLSVTPFEGPSKNVKRNLRYAQEMVGAAEALRREPGDSALIVAIVDSGIDLDHPEFEGRLRPGIDSVTLDEERIARWVTLSDPRRRARRTEARDDMGHGSACASVVGARGRRIPQGLGGAARLLPIRVLTAARIRGKKALTAIGAVPDIDAGVKAAIDLGARVLNLSFGTPENAIEEGSPLPHTEVIQYGLARGCVFVAASGNTGETLKFYPAALPGVIAVGSVGASGEPSAFSTRGDHVALSAPGESIPSAGLGGYQTTTGTSFAAPFVTGACALVMASAARHSRPIGAEAVKRILSGAARPFPRGVAATGCGRGVLDVPRALAALEAEITAEDSDRDLEGRVAAISSNDGAYR